MKEKRLNDIELKESTRCSLCQSELEFERLNSYQKIICQSCISRILEELSKSKNKKEVFLIDFGVYL